MDGVDVDEQSPSTVAKEGSFNGSKFHNFKDSMFIASRGSVYVHEKRTDPTYEIRKIADWLTPINFRTIHRDTLLKRTHGTGMWFIESPDFQRWITQPHGVIGIEGIPGSGKTVLSSIIIDYLERMIDTDRDAFVFVYCRHDDSHSVTEILASMVKQLVESTDTHSSVFATVNAVYMAHKKTSTHPVIEDLLDLLKKIFLSLNRTYVVLDALDEVPSTYQDHLIAVLLGLPASLLFTSRPMHIIDLPSDAIVLSVGNQNQVDINRFLQQSLRQNSHISRVLRGRENRIDQVCAKIGETSDGMFLLAFLQIESLRGCVTMSKLSKALDLLPADLNATYRSALARIDGQDGDFPALAKRAITWIIYAHRSLTIKELMHALAIEDSEMSFDDDNVPPQDLIIAASCGMIEVQPESGVARLVHYTAYDFFKQNSDVLIPSPHAFIAKSCITYLTAFGFIKLEITTVRQFWEFVQTGPLIEYAYRNWVFHCQQCDEETYPAQIVSEFVLQTIRYPVLHTDWDLEWYQPCHVVAHYGLRRVPIKWEECCNQRTTEKHTPLILVAMKGCDIFLQPLLSCISIDVNARNYSGETALMLASKEGHNFVVTALLSCDPIDIHIKNTRGYTALLHASMQNHNAVVKSLLTYSRINVNHQNREGFTALMYACLNGNSEITSQLLFVEGIDVNLRNDYGNTALLLASRTGHLIIVKALVLFRSIDANFRNREGNSALTVASANSQTSVVEILLSLHDIDVNMRNNKGETALTYATVLGNIDIVKALLSSDDTDVDLQRNDGSTALMLAAMHNHIDIVTALLSSRTPNVNLQDTRGFTALSLACQHSHNAVVKTLLSCRSIDVNLQTSEGLTALMLASGKTQNSIAIVKDLLSFRSIDINLQNNHGYTALMHASSYGHNEAAAHLLSVQDVRGDLVEKCGRTAFLIAAEEGYHGIVDALLPFQADLNLQDKNGDTALSLASKKGYQIVVDTLLACCNININLPDANGETPLMHICQRDNTSILKAFLSFEGIDVNARNNHGSTALMYASWAGRTDMVKILLLFPGIDVDLQNNSGDTALSYASTYHHLDIVDALISFLGIKH